MPTENSDLIQKQLFFEDRFGNIKKLGEIQQFEFNENEEKNDAVDAFKYAVMVKMSKKASRSFQKKLGIATVSRNRFIKLLMGHMIQRNDAKKLADIVINNGERYSYVVIDWIINNLEKSRQQIYNNN